MNLIRTMALLLWVALLCPFANGQITCGFDEDQDSLLAQDSMYKWKYHEHANYVNWYRQNYNLTQTYQQTGSGTAALTTCNRAIFIVPVVFHVMYDPSVPATNVSDSIIEAQLDMMNKAFANQLGSTHPNAVNTEIQFCLAQKRPNGTSFSGINRVSYTGSHNKPSGAQKAGVAAAIYYDRERYVNIWIVKDIKDANGISTNIAGYSNVSYQAGIDGIVIRYDFMGDYAGCNSCFNSASGGRVLAHEMGHFLGLFHTFQGNNCSNSGIDSTDCDRKGDLCCDTRPCFEQFDCPTGTTQPDCPNLPFYAGQDDNRNNIMSYADQPCQNNFTLNQTQIMQAVLMGKRQGLIETKNLNHLALSCCHRSAWFNASNTFMCNPSTVKFSAVKQTGVTYRWLIALGGNIVMDTTLSVDSFNFFVSTQGIYDVLLEVSDSTGVISLPRQGFLEYADCGNNLASTQGNWYFGRYAGLRFTTVGPVKDLSAAIASPPTIYCGEGSVSHSDNNGQLIFYGGGDSLETNPYFRIYKDSIGFNHIEVNKDNLLTGHTSSAQGGIVIPFDGNTNKFYLIVTGGAYQQSLNETVTTGARYSIIDRTKPNIVDTPNVNIPILPPAGADDNTDGAVYCGEFITAIPRCGGGHWLILKYIGTGSYSNKILVYLVTDSTITFHSSAAASINDQYFGQLKASPDGNFVAAPGYIFRFNPNTGILILFREYQTDPYNQQYYGCSFSPNSKVLYVTEADYNNFSFKLIQFDLLSTNDSLSRREIDVEDNFYFFQSLQLAPDNRIYMARAGVPQVAVINFPDNLNSQSNSNNCSFELNGPELQNSNGQGGTCVSGLPNMMDALSPGQFTLDFYHIDSNCRTVKFFPNKFCDTVVKWFFGDGDSSTSQFPEHTYAVSDSFTVRMEMSGGAFVQKRIKIGLDNPIIAGDSFVSCNASTQHVYSISNLNDRLHYTWAKNGTSILDVDNFYNANVTISGLSNQLTVEAADPRTGCKAYDTLVVVRGATPASDTLWADSLPCIESSQVTLRGHKYANTAYQWYYSKDSVNWTAISGATADTLTTTLGHDSAYFKRYISNFGCAAYSNVAKLKPQIYISRQPENYVACHGNTIYYDIEVGNPLGASISYAWQGINLQGNWATIATTPYLTNGTTPAPGDTIIFRCLIITPCDTIYSDTVYAVSEPRPDFLIHPQTQTVNEESNAIFIAKGNAIKEQSYQWFYSWNNGANWDSIPGEHNDTLAINNVSMCNDNFQYAAVVYNSCSYLFGSESSDAATLSVNKTRFADLWWRDNLWDGGVEPTIDSNGIWYSPDLWVRRNADGDTNHQNPDYDTATSNYIYYRIKNRGTDTSKGGELYLYWSKTGFGERWPIDWTSNSSNVYVNPCVGTIYHGNTYAMGGEVNTAPINIPPLPPGGEYVANIAWFPPNPFWYGTRIRPFGIGVNIIPDSVDVCLLGRILHCERDSFGLTRKEVQNIKPNIYHNNNIVTRNVKLFNINRIQRKSMTWLVVRNPDDQTSCTDIKLPANTGFSAVGSVKIHLDEKLLDAWEAGGLSGSGYTMLDSGTLQVTPYQTFEMNNICLDINEIAQIGVEFELDSPATFTTAATYPFTMGQYMPSTDNIVGAVNFDVTVSLDGYDSSGDHVDSLEFAISPNPTFPGLVQVSIDCNFSTSGATINVYDGLGNPVITPHYIGTLSSGGQIESVNLNGVSSGAYNMVITANGVNYSGIVIVL